MRLFPQSKSLFLALSCAAAFSLNAFAEDDELQYGDGKAKGVRSIGGGGPIVEFTAPKAIGVALTGLKIQGSRYGEAKAPDEDISVYVLDAETGKLVAEKKFPYKEFKKRSGTEPKNQYWVKIKFDKPAQVPKKFKVYVNPNAEATKGIYFAFGGSGDTHSKTGSGAPPKDMEEDNAPFDNGDWLISALVR